MMCLLLLIFLPFVTSSCPWISADRLMEYDNKNISVSKTPIWTSTSLDKSECILRCYEQGLCFSIQFNTAGWTCNAFKERFKGITVPTTSQPGLLLYQMGKHAVPGSPCEEAVDCDSLSNSQCHEGSCRCEQGYDADGDTCRILTECTSFSDNFTKYPGSYLFGRELAFEYTMYYDSPADCRQLCLATPGCTSFVLDFGYCTLPSEFWTEARESEKMTGVGTDYYQRVCNW